MFEWLERAVSGIRDWLDNNESTVMQNGARALAVVCLVIALVYTVLFYKQISTW